MHTEEALEIFRRTGVMQEGHFRLTSGRHSNRYMQCARLFEYPAESAQISAAIAAFFKQDKIDFVIGPALGGVIMAYEVARALGVRNIFAERENGAMTLRRGFSVQSGDRALVVEDVVTTGGSVKEVIDLMQAKGVEIVGVGAVLDRSNGSVQFGVPFKPLVTMEVLSWTAEECPLCQQGLPVVKPGSRS